jgi:hypothetical protein
MNNLEIVSISVNLPEQLITLCETFNEKSSDIKTFDCILYINIDPYPNKKNIERMETISNKYFKQVDITYGEECFSSKAYLNLVKKVKNNVFLSLPGGRSWHNEKFSLLKMKNDLLNDSHAQEICMICDPNKIYRDYAADGPCCLHKTDFWKKILLPSMSIWLDMEYQLRELYLLENAKCRNYEIDNNQDKYYGGNYFSGNFKKEKKLFYGNKCTDEEIDKIIEENGEWHQIIYDKYKNNKNVKNDILENLRKKTLDKEWIYRWTGKGTYLPINNAYYKRYLKSSRLYKCNN